MGKCLHHILLNPTRSCQILSVAREGRLEVAKEHPKDTGSCHCDLQLLLSPSRTWGDGYLLSFPSAQVSLVSPLCLPDSVPNMC